MATVATVDSFIVRLALRRDLAAAFATRDERAKVVGEGFNRDATFQYWNGLAAGLQAALDLVERM